jgi:hypothetical protein
MPSSGPDLVHPGAILDLAEPGQQSLASVAGLTAKNSMPEHLGLAHRHLAAEAAGHLVLGGVQLPAPTS